MLYTVRGGKRGAFVMAFDLRTRQEKIIVREGSDARYLPTGQLLYGVKGALHIVPFDLDRLEVAGTPVAVSDAVMTTPIGGMLNVDVSSDGTAVYVPSSAPVTGRKIVWVDRQGHEESTRMPVRAYTYPRFSPDGSRIAFDIRDQENDIWIWNVSRGGLTRFTFDPGFDQQPLWTVDGRRIIFGSSRVGKRESLLASIGRCRRGGTRGHVAVRSGRKCHLTGRYSHRLPHG